MVMEGSVIKQALAVIMANGKRAYVRKKNGFFYSGVVVMVDNNHVQIADREVGMIVIALSEIDEAREDRVGVG